MNTTNLLKRGDTYYARVAIPRQLQNTLGKREIVRSLKTTSLAEANRLKHAVVAEIRALISDAEQSSSGSTSSTPAAALIASLRTLRRERRMKLLGEAEVDQTKRHLIDHAHDLDGTGRVPDDSTRQAIRTAVDAVDDDSIILLTEAVDLYLDAHQPPIITKQTLSSKKRRLKELQTHLGVDLEVRQVTGQMASQYIMRDLLKRKRAPKTKKDIITDLSAFFAWCELQDMVSQNPFKGKSSLVKVSSRGTISDTEPRPWTPDELLLFAKGAPIADRHYRLVFFILGLYTGCRLNELAELKLKDVHEGYIKVTSGKSKAALRDVPLHPLLVPLVDHLREASTDKYLIPGLRRGGQNDRRGHYVSQRFTTLRRKLGIIDPGCRYHSLRGNFITALERSRVPLNEIESLIGHKRKALAYGTYSEGVDLEHQRKNVKLVTFGKPVDKLVTRRITELLAEASG